MESYDDHEETGGSYRPTELEGSQRDIMRAKVEELMQTKEELERAKDDATESWLDSRPLIDELERLKPELEIAQNGASVSEIVASEIESELERTIMNIRSKKEEELKARKIINEMNRGADNIREELEQLEMEKGEERRERIKMEQMLRLRRQTSQTLQLRLRAVRVETEAFGATLAEALRYISFSHMGSTTIEIAQEEYSALKRKAKEETSLAAWRISVCDEQMIAVEAARDSALTRLKEISRQQETGEKIIPGDEEKKAEEEGEDVSVQGGESVKNSELAFPKGRAEVIAKSKQKGRLKSRKNKILGKKKKSSILRKIKGRILLIITRFFR